MTFTQLLVSGSVTEEARPKTALSLLEDGKATWC